MIWGFSSIFFWNIREKHVEHCSARKSFAIYNMSIDRRFVYGPPVGCQSSARDHQQDFLLPKITFFDSISSHSNTAAKVCDSSHSKEKPQFGNNNSTVLLQWPLGQLSTIFLFWLTNHLSQGDLYRCRCCPHVMQNTHSCSWWQAKDVTLRPFSSIIRLP